MSNNLINNFCIMNNVIMPIVTSREGNKITKRCVEDVYKMVNRIIEGMNKAYNKAAEDIDSIVKRVPAKDEYGKSITAEGYLVIGTGISQPCLTDAFDEEIGNNLAFMKAKLNANLKKLRLIDRIENNWLKAINAFEDEAEKIGEMILMDLEGIRRHNPEYLEGIEYELGLVGDEEEEEDEA